MGMEEVVERIVEVKGVDEEVDIARRERENII